jgi:hypothetical protein
VVLYSYLLVWFILQRCMWVTVGSRLIEVECWWKGLLIGRVHWSARGKTRTYATLPTTRESALECSQ